MARFCLIPTISTYYDTLLSARARACWTLAFCGLAATLAGCHSGTPPHGAAKTPAGSLSYRLELADALKDGIPIDPQALQEPEPPVEQNAAPFYAQLAALLGSRPLPSNITRLTSHTIPSDRQFDLARADLAPYSDILEQVRMVAERPKCVFVADWSDPNRVEVIKPGVVRSISRLLRARSLVLAHQDKPLDAVKWQALGFQIARHIADQNWGYSDAYFVESSATGGLVEILLIAGDEPEVAGAVRAAIESSWEPYSLARMLKTRAGMNAVILENLRAAGPASLLPLIARSSVTPASIDPQHWDSFIDENGSQLLRHSQTIAAIADMPYVRAHPAFRTAETSVDADNNPNHLLLGLMEEKHDDMLEQRTSAIARAQVTRAAAAVLEWKVRHRAYPTSLSQAISPAPADPFSDKPLSYRREGWGFVVYSVGKSGKHAGGRISQAARKGEAVFRYPLPPSLKGPIKE